VDSLVEGLDSAPQCVGASLMLVEQSFNAVEPGEWDRFVQQCRASFLCSWKVVCAERLRRRVLLFELHVRSSPGVTHKVGQCALSVARGRVKFLDRLQLLPTHDHLWERGIHLLIERCGPATYEYGSLWNQENRRLLAAPRTASIKDDIFQIDRINFAEWPDFAAYRRAVSENVRRDYKKAAAASAAVVVRAGTAALGELGSFVRLRREVMRRNKEPHSTPADFGRHALKLLCLGTDAFIATVRTRDGCHAAFFGAQFGDSFYYLAGGTEDRCQGFGSFLFLTLLERWFAERPGGVLYLGSHIGEPTSRTYTGGNLLYRRKLRATSMAGASFTLTMV
jgi:hypothetical protein